MKQISGRCLCGQVQYVVSDDFKYSDFCHCSDCRRFSGSSSSAMAGIEADAFKVLQGGESIKRYIKSENTVLAFCDHCGSSLYAEKPKRGMLHLRLGTLDEAPTMRPSFIPTLAPKQRGTQSAMAFRSLKRDDHDEPCGAYDSSES